MGGDLVLASTTVGVGTRFLLTVPAAAAAGFAEPAAFVSTGGPGTGVPAAGLATAPVAAAAERAAEPAATAAAQAGVGWKPAIMVCDDSPDIRQLLSVVLDRAGADVILAPTGEDAVAAVPARRPDAVLLDLSLPGMSGMAVADHLRATGYDGPVIAVTGGGDDLTPATLREHGFSDIVHKPTPGSVLVEVLARHLPQWTPRRHRAGQAR